MRYKVFLVEDEIVTREGIRDNVDWGAAGFEFCGEASDGEMALQLIQETEPDVLITDIKMPFMDGLQLSRLVREHMPWIKIIILSGHDEFNYAQSAVKMGVTEYLLKPISANDLHEVLVRIAKILEKEKQENEHIKEMQSRVESSMILSREKFLMDLVMGALTSSQSIEQSHQLGMDILARYYMVALVKINLCDPAQPFDYHKFKYVEQIVSEFAGSNLDVFLTKKDFEELVLLIKGDNREQMIQETNFLLDLIAAEINTRTDCKIVIEKGSLQDRLGNVHLSFLDALLKSERNAAAKDHATDTGPIGLAHIDQHQIEKFLKFGAIQEFDDFFEKVIQPVGELALQSDLMKQYLFVDLILTANQFVSSLFGINDESSPELSDLENMLGEIASMDEIKLQTRKILQNALQIRNSQVSDERTHLFRNVIAYLEKNFENPELNLGEVAENFNLTPNYFSTLFSQEMGQTFRDYITSLRIDQAKALLRTTNIKISEIAARSGYKESHYFSYLFKKKTGQTPSQFREKPQGFSQEE